MWHMWAAALPCALVAGLIYSYPTYSNALQAAFNLTETEKETIGLAPSLCNIVTYTSGLIIDQIGLSAGCFIGGLISTIAYGLFGAVAHGLVVPSRWPPAAVFFANPNPHPNPHPHPHPHPDQVAAGRRLLRALRGGQLRRQPGHLRRVHRALQG